MIYHKTARPDWTRIAQKAILESAQTAPLHGPEQIYKYGQSSGLIERLFEDITRQNADAEYYEDEDYVVRWKRQDGQAVKIRIIDKTTELKRVKLVLSYDGRFFRGFQVQPNVRTVAGVLEEQISLVNDYRTRVHGASRTDEGVHALGQVAHFDTHHDFDEERWRVILNHALPYDVHVLDVAFVPFSFHARYSVVHKVYQYVLNTGEYEPTRGHYEWTISPLDEAKLRMVLSEFVGTHDFTSFCTKGKESTVRTLLRTDLIRDGERLILTFEAEGFLHHMIRLIVSAALRIVRGELDETVASLFAMKSRKKTNHIAPSSGLYLKQVIYND